MLYGLDVNFNIMIWLYFTILLFIGIIGDFIIDLISFKRFAKKYYYIDINLFVFTKELIKSKKIRHYI